MRRALKEDDVLACIFVAGRPGTWVECVRDAPKTWSMEVEINVSGRGLCVGGVEMISKATLPLQGV